jgi:hypothetical protein
MQTAQCFTEGCTRPEAGYGYCTDHGYEAEETTPAEPRTGWREDGRVDIDAVRAGTHDVNDSPAVFESLCDEVEELREIVRQVGSMQDRIPDDQNGDWGIGWDDGYNAALDEVRAVAKGGDL